MEIIQSIGELRSLLQSNQGQTVGLVPTMGSLHKGHLQLIQRARQECDRVILSIFVNPMQFGPGEDFEKYPRDLERDAKLAEANGVDLLFSPQVSAMYPEPSLTKVIVQELTEKLCGRDRPGHFDGVTTVVCKLFHIVQPDYAYFGQKDAQQVAVIEQMVRDQFFPVKIVICPIVREEDGLALSSRNVYLSAEERRQAPILFHTLQEVRAGIGMDRWRHVEEVEQFMREQLQSQPLAQVDYAKVVTYPTLRPPAHLSQRPILVALAVRFGATRLIDNVLIPTTME